MTKCVSLCHFLSFIPGGKALSPQQEKKVQKICLKTPHNGLCWLKVALLMFA